MDAGGLVGCFLEGPESSNYSSVDDARQSTDQSDIANLVLASVSLEGAF